MSAAPQPTRRTDAQRRLVRTLFQWRWTAIWFFALFMGFTLMIAYWFPPIYKVEAKLLVKAGRQMEPVVAMPMAQAGAAFRTSLEDVNSEIEIMLSRPVMERAADAIIAEQGPPDPSKKPSSPVGAALDAFKTWAADVGLVPEVEPREKLINHLGTEMTVEPVPMSSIIEMTYTNFSAKSAEAYVNHVIDAYLEQHARVHSTPGAHAFFKAQADDYQVQLAPIERALTDFRVANDGGDLSQKESLLLQRVTETEDMLRSLRGIGVGEEDLLTDAALLENREVSLIRERLLTLRLQVAEQRLRYAADSPEVRALESQITAARTELSEQLRRTAGLLERNLAELREELREVQRRSSEYDRLVEQERLLRSTRDTYMAKAEEERIAAAMDAEQMVSVRVLQRPALPVKAWFPNRFVLFVLGIFLGIPGAITVALLRGYFHARVATVDDVEDVLEVPVVGAARQVWRYSFRKGMPAPLLDAARSALVVVERRPELRVLHLGASSRGEGTRTFAAALAQAAAERPGRKVVLALSGPAFPAVGADALHLDGMSFAEVTELVRAQAAKDQLVILAGPPLSEGLGVAYASLADASLFVVSGRGVHIEAARRGLQVLRRASKEVLGAVLTRRRDPIPRLLYRRV